MFEILFDLLKMTVAKVVAKQVSVQVDNFFIKRRITAKIESAVANVLESLTPFFAAEKLSSEDQKILFEVFSHEIDSILESPAQIFQSSLDGQKLYDAVYAEGKLPPQILALSLEHIYSLLFPQLANLVFALPPIISQWQAEGFRESFRRLDDITVTLELIGKRLEASSEAAHSSPDRLLGRVRQNLLQRVEFHLELAGLRGDRPDALPLEKLFVEPEVLSKKEYQARNSYKYPKKRSATEIDRATIFSASKSRNVIVGSPGSGKTTLCLWLQRKLLLDTSQRLPVRTRLREIGKRENIPSLFELIRDSVGIHNRDEVTPEIARHWIDSGQVLLILDGFDEVATPMRDQVEDWINQLASGVIASNQYQFNQRGSIETDSGRP